MYQQPPEQPQYPRQPYYPQQPTPPMQPPMGYVQPTPPPQYQPPMQPPKKPRRWPWIVALIVVFFFGYAVGHAGSSTSTAPTTDVQQQSGAAQAQATTAPAQPTKPPHVAKWTTIQSFSGNGSKKTGTFAVPDDWRMNWSCTEKNGIDSPLFIIVYNSDNSIADPGTQFNCAANKVSTGGTEEHQAGNVYLDINSGIDWTITVQALK